MKTCCILAATVASVVRIAHANTCSVPGTSREWVTATCMLKTGRADAESVEVRECVRRQTDIDQPCELNVGFKQAYCKLLVEKGGYAGAVVTCVRDTRVLPVPVGGSKAHAE
jgi:hypothetical protein